MYSARVDFVWAHVALVSYVEPCNLNLAYFNSVHLNSCNAECISLGCISRGYIPLQIGQLACIPLAQRFRELLLSMLQPHTAARYAVQCRACRQRCSRGGMPFDATEGHHDWPLFGYVLERRGDGSPAHMARDLISAVT